MSLLRRRKPSTPPGTARSSAVTTAAAPATLPPTPDSTSTWLPVVPSQRQRRAAGDGYAINGPESSDLARFVADADARGYDVSLRQWHEGPFGGFVDVYMRRRADGVTVPLDGSVIYSFGPRFWDELPAYVEAEAALERRAATRLQPATV